MKETSFRAIWTCVTLILGILAPSPGILAQSADFLTITTIAGIGTAGYNGDGGSGTLAQISGVRFIAIDSEGDVYFSDTGNNRIRKVSVSGTITSIAGTGNAACSGDGGAASAAEISRPAGIAVDSFGNLYFVDAGNIRIRKVSASGVISTVAGNGIYGFSGDGGPATSAALGHPVAVATDLSGNLYIAEIDNQRIRKVDVAGIITTIVGDGTAGYNGDNIPATSARISNPAAIVFDSLGNLYIADSINNRVRRVNPSGIITTVAGGGTDILSDGIAATSAELSGPTGIAIDSSGNLYIAEGDENRIRMVDNSGTIRTVVGDGSFGYNGDNIAARSAKLATPFSIALDSVGNLYIADFNNQRIRKLH